MIGLDTNVLVRYLTQDDPVQSKKANALVDRAIKSEQALHVCTVVLCELVWVLLGAYKLPKERILAALDRMLETPQLDIEQRDKVRRALSDYRSNAGDFADYVIGRVNEGYGCATTRTFDRRLRRHPAFRLL